MTGYLRLVSQLGDLGLRVWMNCIQLQQFWSVDPGTEAETDTKT
jgi:hypothetical protein